MPPTIHDLLRVSILVDTYGPAKVARATSILDKDARYFPEHEPELWKLSHFTSITKRSSAWQWALDHVLTEMSEHEDAKSAALRCKGAKV